LSVAYRCLCVYRSTPGDAGTEQLLHAETGLHDCSHRGTPGAKKRSSCSGTVIEHLSKDFGSFLTYRNLVGAGYSFDRCHHCKQNGHSDPHADRFEIAVPAVRIPRTTVEAICKSLGREVLPFGGAHVVLGPYENLAPAGLKPLVQMRECRKVELFSRSASSCDPAYRDATTQEINSAAMHSMSRDMHIALEQANFGVCAAKKNRSRPASVSRARTHVPS